MPEPAENAREAVASTARVEAMRYLAIHPASTRTEIAQGASLADATTRAVLSQLEDLGYVYGDVDAGQRTGKTVRYSLARGKLIADAGQLLAYIVD